MLIYAALLLLFVYLCLYYRKGAPPTKVLCSSQSLVDWALRHIPELKESFLPSPWFPSGVLQTVARPLLKKSLPISYRREIISTPDGGQLRLDWIDCKDGGYQDVVAIIMPGLTGTSSSSYITYIADELTKLGIRGVVMHYRGIGVPLRTPRFYSACSTDDVNCVVEHISTLYPKAKLLAVGFSMGGVMWTNYFSEVGARASERFLGAFIVCITWNCFESTRSLELPLHSSLFNKYLTNRLIVLLKTNAKIFEAHKAQLPNGVRLEKVYSSRNLREFDENFTSKMFGFKGHHDYYSAASPHAQPLHQISIPVVFLNAADDPLSPMSGIPVDDILKNPRLILVITEGGGHLGYLSGLIPHMHSITERMFSQFTHAVLEKPPPLTELPLRHTVSAPLLTNLPPSSESADECFGTRSSARLRA